MGEERKRKASLYDALDLASADKRGRAATAARPSINRWNGRPYSARYFELLEERRALPVSQLKDEFLHALRGNRTIILSGEAGSGKSTQIPQYVLQVASFGSGTMVACTQPSRVASMLVSQRVAEEMDVTLGQEVGYRVPFETCISDQTVLKYLTDDMLLRDAMEDTLLKRYKAIVLDEAHERTLPTDVLLVILKNALEERSDLKVIVMSVTHEVTSFRCHFDSAIMMKVPDTLYPVEIMFTPEPVYDYVQAAIWTALNIHMSEPAGHILIFLSEQLEIDYACWWISKELNDMGDQVGPVNIIPLYSALPLEMQQKIFEPAPVIWKVGGPPGRNIILSTAIAETSLTIDGIVYVIDSGFSNQKVYNPIKWAETYIRSPISKASAHQRAGRAGRTQTGRCYRLYTRRNFDESLEVQSYPESLRCNLANTVLILKRLGVSDLTKFGFMDPPAAQTLGMAVEGLSFMGALDAKGTLTSLGELMGEFPLDPQMSRMIIASVTFNCSNEILSISAMLSG